MFFLYSTAVIVLSLALMATFLETLRHRSSWRASFAVFLVALIFQLLVSFFEATTIRAALAVWRLGYLEESLAFVNFTAFVLPLIVTLDLCTRSKIRRARLLLFCAGFAVCLFASVVKPGFWVSPEPSAFVVVAYAAFFLSLASYLWALLEALIRLLRRKAGDRFLLPPVVAFLARFVYESVLNVGRIELPGRFAETLSPLFAILLGVYLTVRFSLGQLDVFLDRRAVDPDTAQYERHSLSGREREIVDRICGGLGTAECADELCISEKTVNSHLTNIFRKFGVKNRTQLLARLRQLSRF